METHEHLNVANAKRDIDDLADQFFEQRATLIKQNVIAAHPVSLDSANLIANKYFGYRVTQCHLFFMPHRMCFKFDKQTLLIPLFASGESLIYSAGKLVTRCDQPVVVFGDDYGLVNTGRYSLNLVAK
tara:strand:+ start:183 stop:566 length:384 start_codon:yes stop_codon:yes gene_type:complete